MPETAAVSNHHEVLIPWASCRRRAGVPLRVVTLDFHTDVLDSNRRGLPHPSISAYADENFVRQAVADLHHDEHFDWAIRAGIISQALIICLAPLPESGYHEKITVKRNGSLPDTDTMLNHPEKCRKILSSVLQDDFLYPLVEKVPEEPYILDIDCDYFLTEAALEYGAFFASLVCNARMVTLSMENEWVKILKFPEEKITGTGISEKLTAEIYEIQSKKLQSALDNSLKKG